jgi:DinB superfamily
MPDKVTDSLRAALVTLLDELIDGAAKDTAWVLNPRDPGLLASLDGLSAAQASAAPAAGGASIAAHVDHLRYGFELLNRWHRGEDPFADANHSASWSRGMVSEVEWTSRREALRQQASAWREAIHHLDERDERDPTAVISSVVHLAYHFGAIRQIDRSTRGPSARD